MSILHLDSNESSTSNVSSFEKSFTKNKRVMCVFRVHVLLTLFCQISLASFAFNHRMFEFSFAFSPRTKITIDVFGEKQMLVAEKRPVKAFEMLVLQINPCSLRVLHSPRKSSEIGLSRVVLQQWSCRPTALVAPDVRPWHPPCCWM